MNDYERLQKESNLLNLKASRKTLEFKRLKLQLEIEKLDENMKLQDVEITKIEKELDQ